MEEREREVNIMENMIKKKKKKRSHIYKYSKSIYI